MIPFLNLEPILQAPAGHPVSAAKANQLIWGAVNSNFRGFRGIPALCCQVVFLAFSYPSIHHLVPPGPGIPGAFLEQHSLSPVLLILSPSLCPQRDQIGFSSILWYI